jgi:hypothetical protein
MQLYPEVEPANGISEMWHGEKWTKEVKNNELTPMWCDGDSAAQKHYYIDKIAQVANETFIMVLKWVVKNGEVHAESHKLHYSSEVSCHHDESMVLVGDSRKVCGRGRVLCSVTLRLFTHQPSHWFETFLILRHLESINLDFPVSLPATLSYLI